MIALTGSVAQRQGRGPGRGRVAQARPPRAGRQGPGGHLPGRRPGRPRRPRCAPPATGTRARSAAPPAACWSTSRWPTSSSSCWSRRSRTMVVGEPGAGDDVEIGPLMSKAHFDRVTGYLERAEAEGVRAAIGGGALEGDGYFVAPTVLVDVPDGAEAAREEIFGPVVTVETFTDGGRGGDPRQLRALRPVGLGVDQRRPAQPRRRRRGWTPARSGSTPTSCWPTRCPGAGSRAPATAATCRSTRSTTTPAPSTSCTTWGA